MLQIMRNFPLQINLHKLPQVHIYPPTSKTLAWPNSCFRPAGLEIYYLKCFGNSM